MKSWHAALAMALGIGGTLMGLYLAIHFMGPMIRAWLGVPPSFNQDYATKEAWRQARAVQLLSLGLVFFLIGLTSAVAKCSKPLAWSLWAANPFSVGFGYWAFQRLSSDNSPGEYFGNLGLGLLALLSPFVLAPCMLLGALVGGRFRPADGSK